MLIAVQVQPFYYGGLSAADFYVGTLMTSEPLILPTLSRDTQ